MNKALFLDRDGVLNLDYGYVSTPLRTTFVSSCISLIQAANLLGFKVVIITNQSGIARGYYSTSEFEQYSLWIQSFLVSRGAYLDAIYYCPSHPNGIVPEFSTTSLARKPNPYLLIHALNDFQIDPSKSILLGDNITDYQASLMANIKHFFLISDHDRSELLSNLSSNYYLALRQLYTIDPTTAAHSAPPSVLPIKLCL